MNRDFIETEKIYIYIPPQYVSMMEDDARRFEILKKDKKVNMNGFYGLLINGYYEQYYEKEIESVNDIIECMCGIDDSIENKNEAALRILKKVIHSEPVFSKGEKSKRIAFRPNKDTARLMDTIITLHTGAEGISQYFARMFISYCDLPMHKRENIIFKENIEKIGRAIEPKTISRITFKTKDSMEQIHEVIPYKIVKSKEEMYNYLLCADINHNDGSQTAASFRVNRLVGISVAPGTSQISEKVICNLRKMEQCGPQYQIKKDEETCVRLTDYGVRSYRRVYFGRPKEDRIEDRDDGHYYYYNCSQDQLFLYFRRLGKDAEIIYPDSLRNRMKVFFSQASSIYGRE